MLAPWRARREGQAEVIQAEARANALLIESEAHRKARDYLVPEGAHRVGQLDFGSLVRERIEYQEQKRLANIQAVTAKAAAMLEGTQVEDAEPDHDWTARFFSDVQGRCRRNSCRDSGPRYSAAKSSALGGRHCVPWAS